MKQITLFCVWGKDFINSFCTSFYCPSQNEFLPKKKLLFIEYSTLNMICNTLVFWNYSTACFFHICLHFLSILLPPTPPPPQKNSPYLQHSMPSCQLAFLNTSHYSEPWALLSAIQHKNLHMVSRGERVKWDNDEHWI